MSAVIVYIFCLFIFFKAGKGSLSRLLILIFIASLTGYLLFFKFDEFEIVDLLHAAWICITIWAIVWPWKCFKGITEIKVGNPKRVDSLNAILVVLCIIMGVSCAILSYFVLTMVDDINRFKYVDGASDFYYSLGLDMKGFILTTLLYPIGYLLIPYVFYYLSQGRTLRAIFSFLGSMLPVFYGLTYFSRAHMTHFAIIYVAAFYFLGGLLSHKQKKKIKALMIVLGVGALVGFSAISSSRFEDHDYDTGGREINSKNQNSTFVSTIDYFSQWWPISQEMFRRFDGRTMNNAIIFEATEGFFSTITFGLIPSHAEQIKNKRERLFKDYSGAFIGTGAYVLYDQGPLLGIILFIIYYCLVLRQRPKRGSISFSSLLIVFALIQVPLFAIYYSTFDVVLLTLIFLLPIRFYLNVKI